MRPSLSSEESGGSEAPQHGGRRNKVLKVHLVVREVKKFISRWQKFGDRRRYMSLALRSVSSRVVIRSKICTREGRGANELDNFLDIFAVALHAGTFVVPVTYLSVSVDLYSCGAILARRMTQEPARAF